MSEQTLPAPGTYGARRTGNMVIYSPESGALMLCIPYALVDSPVAYRGNHNLCLGSKDGTLQKKNIDTLRKIFPGWDGELFSLEQVPLPEDDGQQPEFELADCFHEKYEKDGETRVGFKANWLNPVGGSGPNTPQPMDEAARKGTITRWGAKWKAINSGKTVKPEPVSTSPKQTQPAAAKNQEAAKPQPAAAPAKKPAAAPARKGSPGVGGLPRTSSADETWEALVKANPGKSEDDLTNTFWEAAQKVTGKTEDLTPAEWGKVMDKLGL